MNEGEGQRCSLAAFNATVDAHDLRREWEEWLRSFELFAELKNVQTQHEKLVMMLTYGGRGLQRIYYNLKPVPEEVIPEPVRVPLMPPEFPEYDNAIIRLNKFFIGKRNDRVELEVFRSLKQGGDDSFNQFVLKLRTQAARCDFGEREEKEILQQITMGARDDRVRDKGLENVMNLDDLTSYAINREVLAQQKEKTKVFRQEEAVALVKQEWQRRPAPRSVHPGGRKDGKPEWNRQSADRDKFAGRSKSGGGALSYQRRADCQRCGSWRHDSNFNRCPAMGSRCHQCGGAGHFARKCRRSGQRKSSGDEANAL